MPLYDFVCPACGARFEELAFGDETPACPQCGPFPFKPGPVHPLASRMGKGLAGCGQAGGCGSAPAAPGSGSACGGNGKFS